MLFRLSPVYILVSVLLAGVTGRNGTVYVISAGKTYTELAVNQLDDRFDASPAAVGNELLLRGETTLYCIAAGKP